MYKNYIFDFYGTLVDIHTDEERPALWKQMAELYRVYGADYTPEQLKKAYHYQCEDAEKALHRETGKEYCEIDLAKIFRVLYQKAPARHAVEHQIIDMDEWTFLTANMFRILSRTRLKTYPHTIQVLKKLKQQGCRLFILSNAQKCFTMPEMEQSGVLPYMDDVYISSEFRMKKPEKDFLGYLLEKEKLKKEETLMIGNDCQSDILSALKNDIDSVFLDTACHHREEQEQMVASVRGENLRPQIYVIEKGDIREILKGM